MSEDEGVWINLNDVFEVEKMVKEDIEKGELKIIVSGYGGFYGKLYNKILEEEYNIQVETVGCCMIGWEDSYTELMEQYIRSLFQRDIFEEAYQKAEKIASNIEFTGDIEDCNDTFFDIVENYSKKRDLIDAFYIQLNESENPMKYKEFCIYWEKNKK